MGPTPKPQSNKSMSDWGIVLAGGSGERLRHMIQRWFGEYIPKQYCTFMGRQSMLEHTLRRACGLVSEQRILSVVGPGHWRYLKRLGPQPLPGRVIESAGQKGTAVGLFFALAHILAEDPNATVYVFPSDHFIYPEDRYVKELKALRAGLGRQREDRVVLLGAKADRPETDYGWIEVDREHPSPVPGLFQVSRFVEKPPPRMASRLHRSGALWNTMIVLARAGTLWELGCRFLPELMQRIRGFTRILKAVRAGRSAPEMESVAARHLFEYVESADLSRDLLQRTAPSLLTQPMEDIHWCDWGRPERIKETLARFRSMAPLRA